jgi:hypothetical protein
MKTPSYRGVAGPILALCLLLCMPTAHGFLGVADTSFVTVIANPAEAANWAAELDRLNNQLAAAKGTLQVAGDLRSYAGNPRAALAGLADLGAVTGGVANLASGAQTGTDLAQVWQALGFSGQLSGESELLQDSGPGLSMSVFGQSQSRDPSIYGKLAADAVSSRLARGQVSNEQGVRALVSAALTQAWAQFRLATTESGKQAILTEISQLQSQDQVMTGRRRALLDDLDLADRERRAASQVRSKAADEQELAESSLLNADLRARAQGAESQRAVTLQKTPRPPPAADYSGLRLWTTADAGGSSN